MEKTAHYCREASDEIEVFDRPWFDGSECEARQLSAGPLGFRLERLDLPGLSVCCFRYRAATHFVDMRPGNWLVFMGWFGADGPPNYRGSEFAVEDAVIARRREVHEYTMRTNMSSFEIAVAPSLAAHLGREGRGPSQIRLQGRMMRELSRATREVVATASGWGTSEPDPRVVMALRDGILAKLGAILSPWLNTPGPYPRWGAMEWDYSIIKRAENWRAKRDPSEPVAVPEMATALEVPERSLYRAFHTWAGTGPNHYFALRKLHDFRKRLLADSGGRGAVTRAATETGFVHFGRLAGDYKDLFGESPSRTLRRLGRRSSPRA